MRTFNSNSNMYLEIIQWLHVPTLSRDNVQYLLLLHQLQSQIDKQSTYCPLVLQRLVTVLEQDRKDYSRSDYSGFNQQITRIGIQGREVDRKPHTSKFHPGLTVLVARKSMKVCLFFYCIAADWKKPVAIKKIHITY